MRLIRCYNGQIKKDSSECLTMLIKVNNRGSVPYYGLNNNSTSHSLSDVLFSSLSLCLPVCMSACLPACLPASVYLSVFMYVYLLRCMCKEITPPPPHPLNWVSYCSGLFITPPNATKIPKSCFRCKRKLRMWILTILQPPRYLIFLLVDLDT